MRKLLFIALMAVSCKHREKDARVHEWRTGSANNNSLLYWYIMFGNNNTCYYYSSSAPVSSFSNVTWEESNTLPAEVQNIPEMAVEDVPLTELPDEIDVDVTDQEAPSESESGGESEGSGESGSDGGSSDGGGDGGGGE